MRNLRYYVPGIMLILTAVVIVAVPEILVAFIAALIITAGIAALYIGHKVRKSEIEPGNFDYRSLDDHFFDLSFTRNPIFRCKNW